MFSKKLIQAAIEYLNVIHQLENTKDPLQLELLDEQRIHLHGVLMDLMDEHGIDYGERSEVAQIAEKIVRGKDDSR